MNVLQNRRTEMRIICSSVGILRVLLVPFWWKSKVIVYMRWGEWEKNTLLIKTRERGKFSFLSTKSLIIDFIDLNSWIIFTEIFFVERLFENKVFKYEENNFRLVYKHFVYVYVILFEMKLCENVDHKYEIVRVGGILMVLQFIIN